MLSYSFAIIGGGLTATSMLCHMVEKLTRMGGKGRRLSRELSITLFEKRNVFGPGLPHNEKVVMPFHITNMCTRDMSVRSGQPADFEEWIRRHPDVLESFRHDQPAPPPGSGQQEALCRHVPRGVMGAYLKSRFAEAVESAGNLGIAVELCTGNEVSDLYEEGRQLSLVINGTDGTPVRACSADGVLLATGHWFEPPENRSYIPSPWPASELLAAVPPGIRVGVIGSSLSAIEVALTLTSDGRFARQPSGRLVYLPSTSPRKLTLYSRNGLLPKVRGRTGRRTNRFLTCDHIRRMISSRPGALPLSSVFELLDREGTAAYGNPVDWRRVVNSPDGAVETLRQDIHYAVTGDGPEGELVWQTMLVEIFPVARELYLNLTLAERERFDRFFNTLFFMHAATQPVINAEKLLALMEAGIVSVVKLGSDYRFERSSEDGPYDFMYTGIQGDRRRDTYPYVVNARGQPRSVESDPAGLAHNLLRRGLIQTAESRDAYSYRTGSIVVDPETHRVVRPAAGGRNRSCPPIYAVGAMTRGQMIDASMAYGITRSTERVAEDVIAQSLNRMHR